VDAVSQQQTTEVADLARAVTDAATRLYAYLLREHWNGRTLAGPDYGIRFNARAGRFIKSYLSFVPWKDNLVYAQAQGYWILDNWSMADLGLRDQDHCREIAVACSDYLLSAQRPDGYWEYPNPEWKDRIATVEGNYASVGLLETYLRTRHEPYLDAAKRWYEFAINRVGFQGDNGRLAINYFANRRGGKVPNNSASALRTFALLFKATDDRRYLDPCRGMVIWLNEVQLDTGELPYAVDNPGGTDRVHFLCYQYNAFQLLNLITYYRLTGDEEIVPVLKKLARFVSTGVSAAGAACYDCNHELPEVSYYTAAIAASLSQATMAGLGDYRSLADRVYQRVLSQQNKEGGIAFFSRGNYKLLADRRSYPRSQSMILYHLLLEVKARSHGAA
jgi:hypothetical protein